jgi:predicted transcriptional regulator
MNNVELMNSCVFNQVAIKIYLLIQKNNYVQQISRKCTFSMRRILYYINNFEQENLIYREREGRINYIYYTKKGITLLQSLKQLKILNKNEE